MNWWVNSPSSFLLTMIIPFFNNTMNTTIRYWFPDTQQCRYMSFRTYSEALDAIRLLTTIEGFKAEVKCY